MVSLSGPTTGTISEGINGSGLVTITGTVTNTEPPGAPTWLAGGYTVLDAPAAGTLTIVQNTTGGEGGYTWTYTIDSDDPFLDAIDDGDTTTIDFTVRVTDVSYNAANGYATTVGGVPVVDEHTVTITINGRNEVCFLRGTEIATPTGPRPVEDLAPGDLILTKDNGPQPIRWIGCSTVSDAFRRGNDNLEPIIISADAIAPGMPSADLIVSPQHRILIAAPQCTLLFGEDATLASAKSLLNGHSIRRADKRLENLEYWHIMLDTHDVIFANGCPAETLYFGDMTDQALSKAQAAEIDALFPDLHDEKPVMAYPELKTFEAKVLMSALHG
ncbi:Hint domain-containing protein [Yoonia sp. 2307UL14-13]|uniref:Hint domain-containing protein n=1 Tax=Yoonia sp. 2307UL14-13 TaxID=3126506 RepID=UPI0030995669